MLDKTNKNVHARMHSCLYEVPMGVSGYASIGKVLALPTTGTGPMFDLQNSYEMPVMVACTCDPSPEKVETKGFPGLTGQPVILTGSCKPQRKWLAFLRMTS